MPDPERSRKRKRNWKDRGRFPRGCVNFISTGVKDRGNIFPASNMYAPFPEDKMKERAEIRSKLEDDKGWVKYIRKKDIGVDLKDKKFDIQTLLGSETRDFLAGKSNNFEPIKDLKDCYVFIACFTVPVLTGTYAAAGCHALIRFSRHLSARGVNDVRFVLVIQVAPHWAGNPDEYNRFLSAFPDNFLTIPFDDAESREKVCLTISRTNNPQGDSLIIDPEGKPVRVDSYRGGVVSYGTELHPFTSDLDEQVFIDDELLETSLNLSYHKAVGSAPDDDVDEITRLSDLLACEPKEGCLLKASPTTMGHHPVSVSDLMEGQLVGVYLFGSGHLVQTIEKLVEHCKDLSPKFELLVVPLAIYDYPPNLYSHIQETLAKTNIPSWWYLFPYDDEFARTLWRISGRGSMDKLMLLPVGGEPGEINSHAVLELVGIPFPRSLYPFTSSKLLQERLAAIRQVTLSSVLNKFECVYSCRGGYPIPVDELRGRNVLLFIYPFNGDAQKEKEVDFEVEAQAQAHQNITGRAKAQAYQKVMAKAKAQAQQKIIDYLLQHYSEIQDRYPGCEVVCVPTGAYPSAEIVSTMPWMIVPPGDTTDFVSEKIYLKDLGEKSESTMDITVVSFGENGHICSRRGYEQLKQGKIDSLFGDAITQEIDDGVLMDIENVRQRIL